LISATALGISASAASLEPSISGNGRYVVFASRAPELLPGGEQGRYNVLVRDTRTLVTEAVSVTRDGLAPDGNSYHPGLSRDGRYVVFVSDASNLVTEGPVAPATVYLWDSKAQMIKPVSPVVTSGNPSGYAGRPVVSAHGRVVAFDSESASLVAGDANGVSDVFAYDVGTARLVRESVSSGQTDADGASWAPSISDDGRFITFESFATNIVNTEMNGHSGIFVRDRRRLETRLITIGLDGGPANGNSYGAAISRSGRFVAFVSEASNLVAGDTNGKSDIFLADIRKHSIQRVSVSSDGDEANGFSASPAISATGRFIAFTSLASNLVALDSNGELDTFKRDVVRMKTVMSSLGQNGAALGGPSFAPSISSSGGVAFVTSEAAMPGVDSNGVLDVYVAR
jgi:Tol biopolymer transport system component